MDGDQPRQTCGNCGATNDSAAVICVNCGVVLAAYAAPESVPVDASTDHSESDVPIEVDAPVPPPPPASNAGSDWKSIFEQPLEVPTMIPTPPAEVELHEAPPDDRALDTSIASPASTQPPLKPAAEPAPKADASETTSTPAPRMPFPTPSRTSAPQPWQPTPSRPVPNPAITKIPPEATAFDRRLTRKAPTTPILLGVALILGGCLLSIAMSAGNAGDTAVGLVFLCLVPIGFILVVVGAVVSLSRREGRRPR